MSWQPVLEAVVGATQPLLTGDRRQCAVISSVASALQGCRVSPRDLDLLAIEPEIVSRFAELMWAFTRSRFEAMMKRPVAKP